MSVTVIAVCVALYRVTVRVADEICLVYVVSHVNAYTVVVMTMLG